MALKLSNPESNCAQYQIYHSIIRAGTGRNACLEIKVRAINNQEHDGCPSRNGEESALARARGGRGVIGMLGERIEEERGIKGLLPVGFGRVVGGGDDECYRTEG